MNWQRARRVAGSAAGLLLAAGGLAPGGAWAAPAPHADSPAFGAKFGGELYGVAAVSASDVWAVGLSGGGIILNYNGSTWTETQPTGDQGFFWGVAAPSANSAWAVGGTDWSGSEPMIYQWNGTSWTEQTVPAPPSGGFLDSVTVISATDAWAAGQTGGGPGNGQGAGDRTLIYHWNGTAWTQVPCPTPAPGGGLSGISGTSANDVWAVGWTGTSSNDGTLRTLILHWNGMKWSRVPSPSDAPGVRVRLSAVAALSASNAWAVGDQHEDSNRLVFIVHWNGKDWTAVHSPTPRNGADLLGVSALSARDIWAVGQTSHDGACHPRYCAPAIVHWNGSRWSVVPDPPGLPGHYLNLFWSVAAISPSDAWAVGTTDYETTLESQWNGHAWS